MIDTPKGCPIRKYPGIHEARESGLGGSLGPWKETRFWFVFARALVTRDDDLLKLRYRRHII